MTFPRKDSSTNHIGDDVVLADRVSEDSLSGNQTLLQGFRDFLVVFGLDRAHNF